MSFKQWRSCKWGELCTLEYGKGLKGYKESKGKIPVYGTNGPIGFTDKELCKSDGVIIGRKGAYRGVHYSRNPFFVIDTAFFLNIIDKSKLDMKYAYYNLLTKDINSMDSGSAIPSTSRNDFYNMESNIPPIEEQQIIAQILSTIDDKIEINNQINEKLQFLSQLLFKQWFTDFEFPNEEGLPYKSSGGEMVDSELGKIPKGWNISYLRDTVLEVGTGGDAIKRTPMVEYNTGIRCVRVGDLTNKRNIYSWGFSNVDKDSYTKYQLRKKDILVTRTAVNGLSYYVDKDLPAVFNNGLIRLRVNSNFSPLFIYSNMKTDNFMNHIHKIDGETSTRPNMKIDYLLRYSFVCPPINTQERYTTLIEPLRAKINEIDEENNILTNLRDTLLPKLMNGEIDLSNLKINI
jgi:type I restriction enzyme, S subunit